VLNCPSMKGRAPTYYGTAQYVYDSNVWRLLGGKPGPKQLLFGDGRRLHHVDASIGMKTTAVLSSYSYRNTPFYSLTALDGAHTTTPWRTKTISITSTRKAGSTGSLSGR